jgi:hypothetical protein
MQQPFEAIDGKIRISYLDACPAERLHQAVDQGE